MDRGGSSRAADTATRDADNANRRFIAGVLIVVLVVLVYEHVHLWSGYMRYYINEDHTLSWYAARDLGQFEFRQPTLYGQNYFTVFEAVPSILFRHLGFDTATSVTLAVMLCISVGWLLLAGAAWVRGHFVLATLALVFPLVVSFEYLIAAESPSGRAAGAFLATAATAALVVNPRGIGHVTVFAVLGGLGAVWDPGSLFVIVPAAVYAAVVNAHSRRVLTAGALGLLPGAAWFAYELWFLRTYPDYSFHKAHLGLSGSQLQDSTSNVTRYVSSQAPELFQWGMLPILAAIVLVGALLATRRLAAVLPAVAVVVLFILTLATGRAGEALPGNVYFGYGRNHLALPIAGWFLAFVLAETRPYRHPSMQRTRTTVLVIGIVAVVSFAVRQANFDDRMASVRRGDTVPIGPVEERCRAYADAAEATGTDLVVFYKSAIPAYACGALYYGDLQTLFPFYDRRTWLMHREDRLPRTSFIAADAGPDYCRRAEPVVESCEPVPGAPDTFLVRFPPGPALSVVRAMGDFVRLPPPQSR
jgi:hypothetical protein